MGLEAGEDLGTIAAFIAQAWITVGVANGLDPEQVCHTAGLRYEDIRDPHQQIPRSWYRAVQYAVIDSLPEVAVGIEMGKLGVSLHLGFLGMAAEHCATPLQALRLIEQFSRSIEARDAGALYVDQVPPYVDWVVPRAPGDPPEAIEALFVGTVLLLREWTGSDMSPQIVQLAYARQALREPLETIFNAPIHFETMDCRLRYATQDMDRPQRRANAAILQHLTAHLSRAVAALPSPFVDIVSRTLESQLLAGDTAQLDAARRLGLSTRSLQRRLHAHGVSFHGLLEQARKNLVLRQLVSGSHSIAEVANSAGYRDLSSFNRAFRRWTGMSPRSYRDAQHRLKDGAD